MSSKLLSEVEAALHYSILDVGAVVTETPCGTVKVTGFIFSSELKALVNISEVTVMHSGLGSILVWKATK